MSSKLAGYIKLSFLKEYNLFDIQKVTKNCFPTKLQNDRHLSLEIGLQLHFRASEGSHMSLGATQRRHLQAEAPITADTRHCPLRHPERKQDVDV